MASISLVFDDLNLASGYMVWASNVFREHESPQFQSSVVFNLQIVKDQGRRQKLMRHNTLLLGKAFPNWLSEPEVSPRASSMLAFLLIVKVIMRKLLASNLK